jgi:hypothetical protein
MKRKRNPGLLLAIGAIAGLALGGITAYWWLTRQRPLPPEVPFGSDLVPEDAVMTVSVTTVERQWQRLEDSNSSHLQDAWQQRREELLAGLGVNYEQDIQPWIGQEVTLALLQTREPVALPTEEGEPIPLPDEVEMQWVLLLPIADPELAQTTLSRLQSEQTGTVDTYRGLPVVTRSEGKQPYTISVLENQAIAISPAPELINQVIDTFRGDPAIASNDYYRPAFREIAVTEPFLRIYVNAPIAKQVLSAGSLSPSPFWGIVPLQQNQGMAATIVLNQERIRVRGINWLPADSDAGYDLVTTSSQLPDLLPETTWLMLSGYNLRAFWQRYRQQTTADPEQLANPNVLEQSIRTTTGLDLEQDLLAWMEGEYAMAVLPPADTNGVEAQSGPGLVFMVQASNRRAADAALDQLETALSDRYNLEINDVTVNGTEATRWESRFGSIQVTRAWLDGNVLMLVVGESMADTLLPSPENPLVTSDLFQQLTDSSLSPGGHGFINFEDITDGVNNLPASPLPEPAKFLFGHLRAVGVTSAVESDRSTRYDLNIILAEPKEPAEAISPGEE